MPTTTPKIQLLPQMLADIIAAGEVAERPASVVKELAENSLDAGAHTITVEIKGGGSELIRVADDGCGIPVEDVKTAFLRHATSKIARRQDLERIGTLGFRGEALAAISAVSRVSMTTKTQDGETGTRVFLEGGEVTEFERCAARAGTEIEVRDLFYNTPARRKFLKTDRAESGEILRTMTRLALSRPDIAFRYIRDGQTEFSSPGDGKAESCVYSVLGRDFLLALTPVSFSSEDGGAQDSAKITVTGFSSDPEQLRGARTSQFFFVNGRGIRSARLTAAVEAAYRNRQFAGKFPACVIYVEVSPASVDVNVHPQKTEIKFLYENEVFSAVYHAVLSALDGKNSALRPTVSAQPAVLPERAAVPANAGLPAEAAPVPGGTYYAAPSSEKPGGYFMKQPELVYNARVFADIPNELLQTTSEKEHETPEADSKTEAAPAEPAEELAQPAFNAVRIPEYRYVGEFFTRYIAVETGDTLVIIDKHAAHERMYFDAMKQSAANAAAQAATQELLMPIVMTISGEELDALEQSSELLLSIGFVLEAFGAKSLTVRAVPADIAFADIESTVEELAENLTNGRFSAEKRIDEALASVACKKAIKSGTGSDPKELDALIAAVLSGAVTQCPHGRPVKKVWAKGDFDKMFLRI
ncbi:MAG: DNA mismatch repair endonuclease MutL [Oscillospiraceae bacterium]|jgi:DNA mismatch repair protein MutL|nr:DNA mismatch repair endonuclease MutL [Oscillospiraceae bacterium]